MELRKSGVLLLVCISICISWISRSVASASSNDVFLLGVAPQDEKYYQDGWSWSGTLKCIDGSKHFTKSQLNDDFCDCPDGFDEPGTSACPNGRFYCKNAGHAPLSIYSSRVNDGICDCCDGSDEYDGRIKCPNTCWEAGKEARDKLKKKIATYKEGAIIRKLEVEQAKIAFAKDQAELSKLKSDENILKELFEQLKEQKEQLERAEDKARLQKEKEEKEKKEAEEAKLKESKATNKADVPEEDSMKNDIQANIGLLEDSSSSEGIGDEHENKVVEVDQTEEVRNGGTLRNEVEQVKEEDGVEHMKDDSALHASTKEEETIGEARNGLESRKEEKDAAENTGSLSREELGRLVASRWTGEKTDEQTEEVDDATSSGHENHEDSAEIQDVEQNSYDSEDDEHIYDDGDDSEEHSGDFSAEDHVDSSSYKSESEEESDLSDIESLSGLSWLGRIRKTIRKILQAVNLYQGQVDKSEAERIRREYDDSRVKLSKMQSKISSLTKKLKQDFGPEKEFYSFYGQCFEIKQNKYVYKICPFKEASQNEGYSTTTLGNWDKFEDFYRTMQFSNGDRCWNGPERSLKVKLRCGLKNEVTNVDEPSRCEYLALLSTPLLCHEEKLKELQDKLDMMNNEQPQVHDEL